MKRRSTVRLIVPVLFAALAMIAFQPRIAICEFDCGVPFEAVPSPASFPFDVPDVLFTANGNDNFVGIFDVHLDWDWTVGEDSLAGRWGGDELVEFAELLVDSTNSAREEGLAHAIVDYFARNEYAGRDSIWIAYGTGWTSARRHFDIYISDTEQYITAGDSSVTLHIAASGSPGSFVTPDDVALEGFAHEWQHVCYQHWNCSSSSFDKINMNEFFSKASEYLFGIGHMSGSYDLPYDRSLITSDYEAICDRAGNNTPHYANYMLMTAYLHDKFSKSPTTTTDDIVYNWIRQTSPSDSTQGVHSFDTLLDVIDGDSAFDDYFAGSASKQDKFQELQSGYTAALFLNLQAQPDSTRLYTWVAAGDSTPWNTTGYLGDWNGDCKDNALAFPYYATVGSIPATIAGFLDIDDYDYWTCSYSGTAPERFVRLETYAPNYFAFWPADTTSDRQLNVEFYFPHRFSCTDLSTEVQTKVGADMILDLTAIGYENVPTADLDSLHLLGDSATILDHWSIADPGPGQRHVFQVSDFGDTYEGIVFAGTLYPKDTATAPISSAATITSFILPLEYTFYTSGSFDTVSGTISADTTWTGAVYVDGDIVVPTGVTLTLAAGLQVGVVDEDVSFTVAGALVGDGSSGSPVTIRPQATGSGVIDEWEGITVENGATLQLEYCEIIGAEHLSYNLTGRDVLPDEMSLTGCVVEGGQVNLKGVTRFADDTELLGVNGVWIDGGTVTGCRIRQIETPSPSAIPALDLAGDVTVSTSAIEGETIAINAVSTSVLSTLDVKIGPYVTLRNRAANPGIGIYCKNASVEVDSSMIGFGGRSDVGIKVDSGAELFMTYSTIQDWDSWAVQVLASADSANISGYNSFRSPGTLTATGYCFTQADSCTMQFPQTYVQNGRTAELPAENNYWYGQEFCYVCAAEAFVGDIDYEPYETSDQTIGGTFPQFLLAGGDSEPEPADLPAARPRVT
ncbi:hypothetical protein KDL67_05760, partial [bacterium]|nr:hypothetical protein [bacterium]